MASLTVYVLIIVLDPRIYVSMKTHFFFEQRKWVTTSTNSNDFTVTLIYFHIAKDTIWLHEIYDCKLTEHTLVHIMLSTATERVKFIFIG